MTELEQSFQGPGFATTFLYYFALATLIVAIATMEILHVGAQSATPYQYGVAFALPFGLINALTKSSKTMSVEIANQNQFRQQLNQVLTELKYESDEEPELDDGVMYQTFRRAGVAGWLTGAVYVAIAENEAAIASRRSTIKKLSKQL